MKTGDVMNLISSIGYMPMEQDIITRETIELISQQTITTQLVILLVIVIAVGGTIAFFTLRGGIKVFQDLSDNIKASNEVEKERLKTQEKLADAIEDLNYQNAERGKKVDVILAEVKDGIFDLAGKMDKLNELVSNNPKEHEAVYRLLVKLNNTLHQTKEQTDELEAVDLERIKNDQ